VKETNKNQFIYPFALTTSYFSMPQAVIPFQVDSKSPVIGFFVSMIMLQVLFYISRQLVSLWERIHEYISRSQTIKNVVNFLLIRKVDRSKDIEGIIAS